VVLFGSGDDEGSVPNMIPVMAELRRELEQLDRRLDDISGPESVLQVRCPYCVRYVLPVSGDTGVVMDYCPECDLGGFNVGVVWDCSKGKPVYWTGV
jgi:uncharacterized protein with PIN domain